MVALAEPWDGFSAARARDEACRMFNEYNTPCPSCGYTATRKPAWADFGVTFALAGVRYRIVSIGSTNRYAPRHAHFEDSVHCEPVEKHWGLPAAPCPVADMETALDALFRLPTFRPHELAGAYLIEAHT